VTVDRMVEWADVYPDGNDGTQTTGSNAQPLSDIPASADGDGTATAVSADMLPSPTKPMAVAREYAAKHELLCARPTLRHWRGSWWRWQNRQWFELEDRAVRERIYTFTEHAHFLDDQRRTPKPKPWAPNRHKVADVVDALAAARFLAESTSPPAWIGHDGADLLPAGEYVAVRNGLLHVLSRSLTEHTPSYFNLTSVPFDFDPDAPPPKRWQQFLEELFGDDDDESKAALAQYFGYVLSGRTDLHKILLLVGPTRAGKGVIGRVLKSLVGDGNHCGPTLASLSTNFGLAPLIGKPLAIVADARLGGANVHQVVERLLSISGEDVLTIDRKYKDQWTGTLPTRFVIISNELPRFGDASGAIANRFLPLVLTQSWLHREQTDLTSELIAELPGILNWSLDGLADLMGQGRFTEPQSSVDAVVALQDLVSPVAAFVRDSCEQGAFESDCKELWERWKGWAEDNGHRPGSAQTLGRDLRAVIPGLTVVRPREGESRARRYRGVRLRISGTHNG
jgi:putative DNA primase/helicase